MVTAVTLRLSLLIISENNIHDWHGIKFWAYFFSYEGPLTKSDSYKH